MHAVAWNCCFVALLVVMFFERLLGWAVSMVLKVLVKFDVSIDWIAVRPSIDGRLELTVYNVRWHNPRPKYKQADFLKIKQFVLVVDGGTLLSAVRAGFGALVEVEEIAIKGVRVFFEKHSDTGDLNLWDVLNMDAEQTQHALDDAVHRDQDQAKGGAAAAGPAPTGEGGGTAQEDAPPQPQGDAEGARDDEEEKDEEEEEEGSKSRKRRRWRRQRKNKVAPDDSAANHYAVPYQFGVQKFYLLDTTAYAQDFLLSSGSKNVKKTKPIKVHGFILGKKDFKPVKDSQDGLYLDELVMRLVNRVIMPAIDANKTALMMNLMSAAADQAASNAAMVVQGTANIGKDSMVSLMTAFDAQKRPQVRGDASAVGISEELLRCFSSGRPKLKVTIVSGENLARRSTVVLIRLAHKLGEAKSRVKVKSKTQVGTINPTFNEQHEFAPVSSFDDMLKVEVKAKLTLGGEEAIGQSEMPLRDMKLSTPPHGPVPVQLTLGPGKNQEAAKVSGSINLLLQLVE